MKKLIGALLATAALGVGLAAVASAPTPNDREAGTRVTSTPNDREAVAGTTPSDREA